jgi:hypothetical protein
MLFPQMTSLPFPLIPHNFHIAIFFHFSFYPIFPSSSSSLSQPRPLKVKRHVIYNQKLFCTSILSSPPPPHSLITPLCRAAAAVVFVE